MEYRYDFHIHSCLSPCADDEMTPWNLVGMAKVLELDIIAVTDHNSTGNCRAAMQAGAELGVVVIPGMELCTAEEIHVICLFPEIDLAEGFGAMVHERLLPIANKPEIFGNQLRMDAGDTLLGTEPILLSNASQISIDELPRLCREHGGVCYPAHIDRPSYSILAVFGMLDEYMGFSAAELTPQSDEAALLGRYPALAGMRRLRSSDAHALEMMVAEPQTIDLAECTAAAAIRAIEGPSFL